jgi:hypothetical protein
METAGTRGLERKGPQMSDLGTTQPVSDELRRAMGLLTLRKKMMEEGEADPVALLALARMISEVPDATLVLAKKQLGHPQSGGGEGVPEWAKIKYRDDAAKILTCSVLPDGKIGSVFFPDGRIRTVHESGPTKETETAKIIRMNVDEEKSSEAYMRETGISAGQLDWDNHDEWLANYLNGLELKGDLPDWAVLIDDPKGTPLGEDFKLFEIFRSINNTLESWHPSEGIGKKFETDQQTISVLENGIKHIAEIEEAHARNVAFYNYVTERLPKFTQYLRHPDEVSSDGE